MRTIRLGSVAAAAALVVGAAPALGGGAHTACGYRAAYHFPNHHPRANRNWWVRVSVSPASLTTRMHYEFYFSGRRVATRYVLGKRDYHFRGHMADAVVFPRRAEGIPLTFRVVLGNRCGSRHQDWKVTVVS